MTAAREEFNFTVRRTHPAALQDQGLECPEFFLERLPLNAGRTKYINVLRKELEALS